MDTRFLSAVVSVTVLSLAGCGGGNDDANAFGDDRGSCGAIPAGGTTARTRYEAPTGGAGVGCVSEEETGVCRNGAIQWMGDTDYEYDSCLEPACSYDGGTLASGGSQSRTRYAAPSVTYPDECASETQIRTCGTGGTLSGWSGTYEYDTCEVLPQFAGSCDMPDDYQCVEYTGSSYSTSDASAACAQGTYLSGRCPADDLIGRCTVDMGGVGGYEVVYLYYLDSFTPTSAQSMCTALSGTWEAGGAPCDGGASLHATVETRTRYENAEVDPGQDCVSEEQTRECDDGTWTTWTGAFAHDACSARVESCVGDATTCADLNQNQCGSSTYFGQRGCTWTTGCTTTEAGFAYNCDNYTHIYDAATVCPTITGCSWDGSMCEGGLHYCTDSVLRTTCDNMATMGFPCAWASSCTGTAVACTSLTQTQCSTQLGCTWQ